MSNHTCSGAPSRCLTLGVLSMFMIAAPAKSQETHIHDDGTVHLHEGLHFTHPIIAESVTPDRKVRFDYQYFDFADGDTENSGIVEAEWAFHRSFSVEVGLPYSFTESEFGNLEVLLKFANYAFEDAGLLLGYGLEIGFPTNGTPEEDRPDDPAGSRVARFMTSFDLVAAEPRFSSGGGGGGVEGTLGTDDWELAPFLNFGWKKGGLELIAWGIFEIPFGGEHHDDEGTGEPIEEEPEEGVELGYNFSALYAFSARIQALIELDGSGGITGGAVGEDNINLAPGIRVQPFPKQALVLGLSAGFPLSNEEFFDTRIKVAAFWHF